MVVGSEAIGTQNLRATSIYLDIFPTAVFHTYERTLALTAFTFLLLGTTRHSVNSKSLRLHSCRICHLHVSQDFSVSRQAVSNASLRMNAVVTTWSLENRISHQRRCCFLSPLEFQNAKANSRYSWLSPEGTSNRCPIGQDQKKRFSNKIQNSVLPSSIYTCHHWWREGR
jgi:hypothetical protein